MLRADADAYGAVGVPAEARTPGDDVGGDGELMLADTHREPVVALLESRLDEVHGRTADEARHEQVHRLVEHRLRLAGLLEHAAAHHGHAIAHRHRLDLVVCDVDRRHTEVALHARDLRAHLHA